MAESYFEGNTLHLGTPVKFGTQEITELIFSDVTGKEMSQVKDNMTFGDIARIGAALCGVSPRMMDALKGSDYRKVIEHTGFLLGGED